MGSAIGKVVDNEKNCIVWKISPEGLRLYAYVCFWVVVLIGGWLTIYYSDVKFDDNPLIHHFGYNNICIFFDTYPATFVLPSIWVINFLLIVSYIVTSWLRIYQGYLLSNISQTSFVLFSASSTIEFICLCLFTTIFSVSPEESLFFHLAPFTCLIFALSFLSIKNYVYYKKVAKLTENEKILGLLYLAVHLFASSVKLIYQINFLSGDILYPTLAYVSFNQYIDRLWMLTAALLPIYYSIKFGNRVPSLVYKVEIWATRTFIPKFVLP